MKIYTFFVQHLIIKTCDMQNDLKRNPIIQDLFMKGRHNKTGIIQCEQYTENTATIEKANTDYFVLIPPFPQSIATYYHEKFMPNLSPRNRKSR